MQAFVTGAAGFIGSNLVDRLLERGHAVVGYDNLSTGYRQFLTGALSHPSFKYIEGDVLDAARLTRPDLRTNANDRVMELTDART